MAVVRGDLVRSNGSGLFRSESADIGALSDSLMDDTPERPLSMIEIGYNDSAPASVSVVLKELTRVWADE